MLIISFSWTTAALLAGVKTCTRRNWNERYARLFKAGMDVQGWNKGPRVGGRQVAIVRLTADPYPERTSMMPAEDYENEGLAWMELQGMKIQGISPREFWDRWKAADELVYVVRFKKLEASELFYTLW